MTSESLTNATMATAATVVITAAALVLGAAVSHKRKKAKDCCAAQDQCKPSQRGIDGLSESWESHLKDHGPLVEIYPGTLYALEAAGTVRGPPVRNMVIYRVPEPEVVGLQQESRGGEELETTGGAGQGRRLVIYNGIAVDEKTLGKIQSLGEPSVLVVPNSYHRCCAAVWKLRFPSLHVVCPAVARESVAEVVHIDRTTGEWASSSEWSDFVHIKTIDGWGDFEDVIEVELEVPAAGKSKKAVLVCDLLFTMKPLVDDASYVDRLMYWIFDSCAERKDNVVIPKVARLSRIFGVKDWSKAEGWYRAYARDHGPSVVAILVGHGDPVVQTDSEMGCTVAFEGVADQLKCPRW